MQKMFTMCTNHLSRRERSTAGFTLVELLVVIGIIAVLISILLPSLAAARRQANVIRCQSSLRQLGHGLTMYSLDFKGYWPTVRHRDTVPEPDVNLAWTNLIANYCTGKKGLATYMEVATVRSSPLWGCPEWTKSFDWNASLGAANAENVYTGYGMQYYPSYFEDGRKLAGLAHWATGRNGYVKAAVWQRKGSSDRAVIMDSQWDIVRIEDEPYNPATALYWPINGNVAMTTSTAHLMSAEARHVKPGATKKQIESSKSINVLFCDMHVEGQTPKQTWNAIRSPGRDRLPGDPAN